MRTARLAATALILTGCGVGGNAGQPPPCTSQTATIAFTRGQTEVFVSDIEGECFNRLVEDVFFGSVPPRPPSISDDGESLAYAGRRQRLSDGGNSTGLVVIDLDSAEAVELTDMDDSEPTWSPDGTHLVFLSAARHVPVDPPMVPLRAYVVDVASGEVEPLTGDALIGPVSKPIWFPGGDRLLFTVVGTEDSGLWVVDKDGKDLTRIFDGGGRPSISPQGDEVLFNDDGKLWVIDLDEGHLRQIHEAGDTLGSAVWSPDGDRIAFVEGVGNANIYLIGADGTGLENLTDDEFSNTTPAWSPDGTLLAFASNRDSTTDGAFVDAHVFVMELADRSLTRISHGEERYSSPVWIG